MSDVSNVKVMPSTAAVIFAYTWVVNSYNIRTEPRFFEPNQTHSKPNPSFKKKKRTEIKKII